MILWRVVSGTMTSTWLPVTSAEQSVTLPLAAGRDLGGGSTQ